MASPDPRWLVWVDLETTGLDHDHDYIIEFASVITDFNLKVFGHVESLVRPPELTIEQLLAVIENDDFINEMHTRNGLKAALKLGPTLTTEKVEESFVYLLKNFGEPQEFLIAGSGVSGFDQPWLDKAMPEASQYWQYRAYDIGVMRRFVRYTLGRFDLFTKESTHHRSMDDVTEFIDQARYLRDHLEIK